MHLLCYISYIHSHTLINQRKDSRNWRKMSQDWKLFKIVARTYIWQTINFGGRKYLRAGTQEQKQNCTEYKDIYIEEHLKPIFYFCKYVETLEALFDTILHMFAANVQHHYSCWKKYALIKKRKNISKNIYGYLHWYCKQAIFETFWWSFIATERQGPYIHHWTISNTFLFLNFGAKLGT